MDTQKNELTNDNLIIPDNHLNQSRLVLMSINSYTCISNPTFERTYRKIEFFEEKFNDYLTEVSGKAVFTYNTLQDEETAKEFTCTFDMKADITNADNGKFTFTLSDGGFWWSTYSVIEGSHAFRHNDWGSTDAPKYSCFKRRIILAEDPFILMELIPAKGNFKYRSYYDTSKHEIKKYSDLTEAEKSFMETMKKQQRQPVKKTTHQTTNKWSTGNYYA